MKRIVLVVLVLAAAIWFGFGKSLLGKGKQAVGRSYDAGRTAAAESE